MSVRAKFTLDSITRTSWGTATVLKFQAVGADEVPENQRYHKYTPSGCLEISVDNPAAVEQFELGKSYYLDFTPVPEAK